MFGKIFTEFNSYVSGEKLYYRYNFTKQKIKEKYGLDGNVSEDELLSLLNLHKIYDYRTLRYSLKRA